MKRLLTSSLLGLLLAAVLTASAHGKPLQVYILAGQSNMEGHARIETFDYIGDDPATAIVREPPAFQPRITITENSRRPGG